MSDKIRAKVEELGEIWENVEDDIIEFLNTKFGSPTDGIEVEEGMNPELTRKMRHYQTDEDGVYLRIRLNKNKRLADSDKIKFRVVIAQEGPSELKVRVKITDKPAKMIKICKRHSELWRSKKFALFETEDGDEAEYESERGGHVATFDVSKMKPRDDFYINMVLQCSTYCQQQLNGPNTSLELVVNQWSNGIMVKEDRKKVKIATDVKKQVECYNRKRLRSDDSPRNAKKSRRESDWSGEWST